MSMGRIAIPNPLFDLTTLPPQKAQATTKKRKRDSTKDQKGKGANKKAKTNNIRKPKSQQQNAAPRQTDLNVRRSLPNKFVCNGRMVANQFQPTVSSNNVTSVTTYFSSYAVGPQGVWESNLVKNLVQKILQYGRGKTVVGCVAWLSNRDILAALQQCARVLLIVNREDYKNGKYGNGSSMLELYKKLPKFDMPLSIAFSHLDSVLSVLETNRVGGKSKYASVRAFGNPGFAFGRGGSSGGLEHCKYLIFFESRCFKRLKKQATPTTWDIKREDGVEDDENPELYEYQYKELPCAVWTGSMNMTKASESNHENAVFIKDTKIALGFFHDFSNTFMVSTPVSSNKSKTGTPSNYVSF